MRRRRHSARASRTALAAMTAAMVLAACGGSGSSGGASGAFHTPLGQRLIASADEICERLNTQILASVPAKKASPTELAANALVHGRLERQAVEKLARLTFPTKARSDWEHLLDYRAQLAQELVAAAKAWKSNDTQTLKQLASAKAQAHAAMSRLARQDGFKACSRIGTAT